MKLAQCGLYVVRLFRDIFFVLVFSKIFTANRNQHSPVVIYLNPRLRARFLKIVPVSGKGGSCFRVEIRGCAKGKFFF